VVQTLKLYTSGQNTIQVRATDYRLVVKELNKIDKTLSLQLKKEYRRIASAGQISVKKEIQTMGRKGPFAGSTRKSNGKPANGMAHGGRTGWGTEYGSAGGPLGNKKRYPYDSVLIETYTRAQKKGTGIARLRVRSAATVITDLARSFRGSGKTRAYPIRLFGGPVIMRQHTKTWKGVAYFIRGLGAMSKPSLKGKSRNVYPGFDKSYPAMRKEVVLVIQKTVRIVKENIDRNSK
jgi:hypothetical protein